jgi:hypothetical protein
VPTRSRSHLQDLERLLPAGRQVYAVHGGHHDILGLPKPMISGGRSRPSADPCRERRIVVSTSTATHLTHDVFR